LLARFDNDRVRVVGRFRVVGRSYVQIRVWDF
jgi:hypothetical protein